MPTIRSTNPQAIDRTKPVRVHNPLALVSMLLVASDEKRERLHLLTLFFISYVTVLAAGLWIAL